jgi:hypothetical protein
MPKREITIFSAHRHTVEFDPGVRNDVAVTALNPYPEQRMMILQHPPEHERLAEASALCKGPVPHDPENAGHLAMIFDP